MYHGSALELDKNGVLVDTEKLQAFQLIKLH